MMKTRISAALSLAIAMIAVWTAPVLAAAPAFTDIAGNPYEEYILYCAERGFMNGYGDGTFRPNGGMSRFEVSNVICNYFKYRANHTFKDLPHTEVISNAAVLMYAHRYLEGFGDNTFRPGSPMEREQAAVLIVKIFDLSLQSEEALPAMDFHDEASISEWARDAVSTVTQYQIMIGDTDGNFRPKAAISRGELCRVLWDINEEEWKKITTPTPPEPAPTVINAADLAELSDLTPEEADGTDPVPDTLTTAAGAHFTAGVSWTDLAADDKMDPGTTVGTVTLTAETGYTFTGTDIDEDALKAVFTMGDPDVAITGNTGETLVFTLSY